MKYVIMVFFVISALFSDVGKIVTLKNSVNVLRDKQVIGAFEGMALQKGDVVNTFARSMARIELQDKTVVTLGKESRFAINDYLYQGEASKSELAFTKGFFKVVSGEIGKLARERFRLKTRTATIGIRGTEIDGFVSRQKEVITCTQGAIWVEANGKRVDVDEGESTIILPSKAPTPPKNYRYEKLVREGLAAFEAKEFAKSKEIFTELIGMEAENPIFYYYLGKSQFRLEQYDAAINSFKKVLTFDSEHYKSHYELGVTYYVIQELEMATREFEAVIAGQDSRKKVQPLTYVMSFYWLGKIHNEKQEYDEAARYFTRVLEFKLKPDFRAKVEAELKKVKSSTGK